MTFANKVIWLMNDSKAIKIFSSIPSFLFLLLSLLHLDCTASIFKPTETLSAINKRENVSTSKPVICCLISHPKNWPQLILELFCKYQNHRFSLSINGTALSCIKMNCYCEIIFLLTRVYAVSLSISEACNYLQSTILPT